MRFKLISVNKLQLKDIHDTLTDISTLVAVVFIFLLA
jgi:hypothetical protein